MEYGRIYKIVNKINDKVYIGQTTKDLQTRFTRHCWTSEYKKNMPICLAIKKYGKEYFEIQEICICNSQEELDIKEVEYVLLYNSISPNGYNLMAGGGGTGIMSEETKVKIGNAHRGKKVSEETRERLRISHLGKKQSEETKKKLSDANKGKKGSDLCYQMVIEKLSKEYTFVSPDGKIVKFKGLNKFCKENNLLQGSMCRVAKGERNHHRGWKLYKGETINEN